MVFLILTRPEGKKDKEERKSQRISNWSLSKKRALRAFRASGHSRAQTLASAPATRARLTMMALRGLVLAALALQVRVARAAACPAAAGRRTCCAAAGVEGAQGTRCPSRRGAPRGLGRPWRAVGAGSGPGAAVQDARKSGACDHELHEKEERKEGRKEARKMR